MKNTLNIALYFLSVFFLTYGCSTDPKIDTNVKKDEIINISDLEDKLQDSLPNIQEKFSDTISIGNYDLIINQTDTVVRLVDYPNSKLPYSKKEPVDANNYIIKISDTLTFPLGNGEYFKLVDVPYNEDDSNFSEAVSYHYVNSIGNYWQVDALCYEYNFTILVNKQSGDTIQTIAPGPISPSKNLILCSNVDLETQYTENGIELYELHKNTHTKIGFKEIANWGLFEIEWISDNKLKALKVDMTEDYNYELRNVTIELKRK
ncbi:MAG: hypothetical protein WDZ35_07605 [Crocinitomicaceae bacterium]